MNRQRWAVSMLLSLGLLVVSAMAQAFPGFLSVTKETYGIAKDSTIDKAHCGLCHVATTKGGALNPFGSDVAKILKDNQTHKLTKELLAKIEALDSDQDGVSNINEIKADTLPGDPNSTPPLKSVQISHIAAPESVDGIAGLLNNATAYPMKSAGTKLGDIRCAIAGQNLAIDVRVYDKRITAGNTEVTGSSIEIAAVASGKKGYRRVLLQQGRLLLDADLFDGANKLEKPEIKSKLTALKENGYEAVALIPLTALQIDPQAPSFLLESAVVAAVTADGKPQFASLFGSPQGYPDSSKFGTATVLTEKGK